MSIYGKVNDTIKHDNGDITLLLIARSESPAGQDKLRIIDNPVHEPTLGSEIWGGADSCILTDAIGDQEIHYRRIGYAKLREMALVQWRKKEHTL